MVNNILLLFSVILIGWSLFEKVSTLQNKQIKKYAVIFISIVIIGWLDFYSLILLTIYSSFIIFVIKQRLRWFSNILLFVILNVFLLIVLKDYYLLFDIQHIYVPLGVSYYFFRLISLVIEYSRNKEKYEKISLLDYYTYVYFFPIFLAGPIQRFQDFYSLQKPLTISERKRKYIYLFFVILVKLVIINIVLYNLSYLYLYDKIVNQLNNYHITVYLYLFGLSAFIHAYMDLMIYTEISKTIAILLGFSKQENFNKPLLATNISKFWQSWHMSLSNWTRDYVFFPFLIKTRKVWLSTYASMMMIGIWHSIAWNWLFWAFMHGSALNIYMWLRNRETFKIMANHKIGNYFLKISGNIVTMLFVSSVFIFIAIHDYSLIIKIIKAIFN